MKAYKTPRKPAKQVNARPKCKLAKPSVAFKKRIDSVAKKNGDENIVSSSSPRPPLK